MTSNRVPAGTRCRGSRPGLRWLPLVLLALGCAGGFNAMDDLDETLRNFHHHLVAQAVDHAANYVSNDGIEAFENLHEPARNLNRLEEYSVVSVREFRPTKEDPSHRATVVVKARLRRADSITVQYVRFRETWQREGTRWMLVDTEMTRMEGEGGRD